MRLSIYPVLLLLLLLTVLAACTDTPRIESIDSDDGIAITVPTSAPESATPTATPPPTSTAVPSATPTPEPLADVVRGNVFEPGDGDGGYLYDMEREVVAMLLEDVLWHPDNEDFFTTHQVRLLETADGEQLVYRLIDPYAEAQIGWHTPITSPEFEYQLVERNGEEVLNLAGRRHLAHMNESVFSIPLLSVEETVVDDEPAIPLVVEVWEEERQAYLARTLLVSAEGVILQGAKADEVYEAKTVVLPILRESIPKPYIHVRTNGRMEAASHQRDEYNRIVFREDSSFSAYLLSRAEVGLERANAALLDNMARARAEGLTRFSMIDPNGYEIFVDVVPPEIQESFEWSWEYRGFYKEEEGKRHVFRTAYTRPDNPNALDAPEYELVQEWVEVLDRLDLTAYGYGIWTLEGDSAALAQPWGNRPPMNPTFNQERAANVAEGWGYLLQGRESLEVAEVPDFGRLDQWRLHKLGRPTELNVEEEPEFFEEIANIESGVTIEIADRYDDSFQLAIGSLIDRPYYLLAYKFRVEGGRPIATIYEGRAVTREGQNATEDSANFAAIGVLWLITKELNQSELMISHGSHLHNSASIGPKDGVTEAIDTFIENFNENFPHNRDELIILISS